MNRIALIVNERSGKSGDPVKDQLCDIARQRGIPWVRTNEIMQAEIALRTFALENIDTLVIYGGDGTLDTILSLMRRGNIFKSEPRIALLRGGTTNMTYRDAGLHGKPAQEFEVILNSGNLKTIQRPVLRIQQAQQPDHYGFFFGLGAVPRAIEATRKKLHTKGMKGPISEALMVSSLLQRLVAGNIRDHPILKPGNVKIETNEDPPFELNCVYMIVSTLDKLLLNLRPAKSTHEKLGIMALTYPYKQLFKHLGPLLDCEAGAPEDSGIWRKKTGAFTLAFDGSWTLDGEIFTANAQAPLRLSIDAPVTFCVKPDPLKASSKNLLLDYIKAESLKPPPTTLEDLTNNIRAKAANPDGIAAILLYGSGLWKQAEPDTVWDLYVLTDRLADYDRRALLRFAGHIMPPNVYYTQDPVPCKFGVMRLDQFARGCSLKSWKPQIWARFAQPCRVLYTRDETTNKAVIEALGDAVLSFHTQALAFAEDPKDARSIWISGLRQTYGSELRSENTDRARELFEAQEAAFTERSKLALPLLSLATANLSAQTFKTNALRPFLKFLYALQLIKASLIFENGVEYALWKIKRHSGMEFTATEFQKKYPLIAGWPLLWKIYKARALR